MNKAGHGGAGLHTTRSRILDAALALVSEGGPAAVTLEAVSARADVSRSGLHYHFRSKELLMVAAAEALVARLKRTRGADPASIADPPNADLKAYVLASVFDPHGHNELTAKAIASGSAPGSALAPMQRYWRERFPPFADAVGFDRAALVHVATEGLWFMDVLALTPFTEDQRARLVRTILSWVDGGAMRSDAPD